MEEEIDLRQHIRVLLRHWYWIVGIALAAAVIAFVIGSLQPPTYVSSALVAITGPRYRMQFDSRMQDVPFDPRTFIKGYTELAISDEILGSLLESANSNLPANDQPLQTASLLGRLEATSVGDGNLVQLTVRGLTPQEVADLANAWAERYVSHLNSLYGKGQSLADLETQVEQTKALVEKADLELAELRSAYGIGYRPSAAPDLAEPASIGLMFQLQEKTRRLANYQARSERVAQLLGEASSIVAAADDEAAPAVVTGLVADMLGMGLLGSNDSGLIQINLGDIDARASARALVVALEAKQATTQKAVEALAKDVTAMQAELAARQMQLEQLVRDQQVGQNTYLTLSSKLQEARIESDGDVARIASRAAAPESPAGRGRLLSAVLAGMVAGLLSVFAVLLIEYWRQEPAAVSNG